jgi:hypothetical protein
MTFKGQVPITSEIKVDSTVLEQVWDVKFPTRRKRT